MARIKYYSEGWGSRRAVDRQEERGAESEGNCRVRIKRRWVCTMRVGHRGDHVAGAGAGHILARWKRCASEVHSG